LAVKSSDFGHGFFIGLLILLIHLLNLLVELG
jgi:hypothetical protein